MFRKLEIELFLGVWRRNKFISNTYGFPAKINRYVDPQPIG